MKLANIAWQTLLLVSESLAMDKKVTPNLRGKQKCLASNVGQFRQAFTGTEIVPLQVILTGFKGPFVSSHKMEKTFIKSTIHYVGSSR